MSKLHTEEIYEGIRLHTVKTDKFKTSLININIQRPLKAEEVTLNSLLPMVLQRGTSEYTTSKEISKKLEYLYGAVLRGNVKKKGELHIIEFSLRIADSSYIEDKSLWMSAVELLNSLINRPLLEDRGFKASYVRQEKSNLDNRIQGRLNDKMQYSLDRLIEEMCKEEGFKLYEHGRQEDLPGIDATNLYSHYLRVMQDSPIDIMVVGNMDHSAVREGILKGIDFKEGSRIAPSQSRLIAAPSKEKKVLEELEINQGKLSMGYRVDIPYSDPLYPAMILYANILGGGPHSKLFIKVREERSLCYYIFAKLEKFKSIMMIGSGIEADKYDIAVEVIGQQLEEMRKGNISKEEMTNAKKAVEASIKSIGDNALAIAEFYYSQVISNPFYEMNALLEKVNKVTVDDIVAVAEKVSLDTIYFLKGRE